MTLYDAEVKNLLSDSIYKTLLEAVDKGKIDQQKAETIAEQLHPTVVGNFRRQVSSDPTVFNRTHFREILSDWYSFSAFDLKHDQAVECLISALKHDNLGKESLYYIKIYPWSVCPSSIPLFTKFQHKLKCSLK